MDEEIEEAIESRKEEMREAVEKQLEFLEDEQNLDNPTESFDPPFDELKKYEILYIIQGLGILSEHPRGTEGEKIIVGGIESKFEEWFDEISEDSLEEIAEKQKKGLPDNAPGVR